MSVLKVALDSSTVIVAVDPGKAVNRVWISNGAGLLTDPLSLSVAREGIAELERALSRHGPREPVIAIEATGSLHRPWVTELERDGLASYAARRRNLACRPLALGRHHGAHESLPLTATNQPAGPARPTDLPKAHFIAQKPSYPLG